MRWRRGVPPITIAIQKAGSRTQTAMTLSFKNVYYVGKYFIQCTFVVPTKP